MKLVTNKVRLISSEFLPFSSTDLGKKVRFKTSHYFNSLTDIKGIMEINFGIKREFNMWEPIHDVEIAQWIHEIIDDFEFDQMDEHLEQLLG